MLNKTRIGPAGCSNQNFPAFRLNAAFLDHVKQESQVVRKATALDFKEAEELVAGAGFEPATFRL
jgi:hypothetical protein